MKKITLSKTEWEQGFKDGLEGSKYNYNNKDNLSYSSGYIEGKAERIKGKSTLRELAKTENFQ